MATVTYTTQGLKLLVLTQINRIKGLSASFEAGDADASYDEAVRECGFENPVAGDADRDIKYQWLMQRMRRWYLARLHEQYILRFDISDMRAGQVERSLEKIVSKLDEAFAEARTAEATAHIFLSQEDVFGSDLVVTSGFLDNAMGEDISYLGQDAASKRPKQPTATQDVIDSLGML